MRIVGLILVMLVVYWSTSILSASYGQDWTWREVQIYAVIVLSLGTMIAVPWIAYLFGADFVVGRFSFPWSLLLYIVLAVAGWAAMVLSIVYVNAGHLPGTDAVWYPFWRFYIPFLTAAAVLPAGRMLKARRAG